MVGVMGTAWTPPSTPSMTPCPPSRPGPPPRPGPRHRRPLPDVPPMSMALRFRALMMFTMMELAEGL